MTRIKLSVNDANGMTVKNAERVHCVALVAGAKPLTDWKKSMDSGRGISTAYYAETLERQYDFDGELTELKSILKGAQYIAAPAGTKATDFGAEEIGGERYLKLCDIDVWFPTRVLFVPSWEKLRTTVVAKKMKLDEGRFVRISLGKYQELMKEASSDLVDAIRRSESDLLGILRSTGSH